MTTMESSDLERLLDITACCPNDTEINQLFRTATGKAIDYATKRHPLTPTPTKADYTRAIDVMQRYASKNYNYTETWYE